MILPTGDILLTTQLKVVDGIGFTNAMFVVSPEQIVGEGGIAVTLGAGFTVISNVTGIPIQLLRGVTVSVAVPAKAINAGISVTPVKSESPIELPPVTSKTVPTGAPVKAIAVVNSPSHKVCGPGLSRLIVTLTITV